jgi:high-affinity Fe2+/Pb2+ permease
MELQMQSIKNNIVTFAELFIVILLILFTPMGTSIIIYGTQISLLFLLAIVIIIKTRSYQLLNRENILKKIILLVLLLAVFLCLFLLPIL